MSEPYLDPFAVLELERTATPEAIKRAYFALVRANPPERNPEQFKRIRAAYEALRDPATRLETEMQLLQPWAPASRRRRPPRPELRLDPEAALLALRAFSDLDRSDWRDQYQNVQL
jgi:curved DNA-binding protein CbpA